jgi:peroxiredoxin
MDYQKAHDAEFRAAKAKNDTATTGKLMRTFYGLADSVREKSAAFRADFVKKHPDALVSVMMLENMLASPGADFKKIKELFSDLNPDLKAGREGKKLEKQIIEMSTVKPGHAAPDFSAPDVNGKRVSLHQSLGPKATIIDFWASWCPPCRAENPNMVALYKDFHGKGLNIIGVSLDKKAEDWKAAIAKDGLTWTEVSNLKFWDDPVAANYNVEEIPQTFVLNQYGVVVSRGLKGEALRKKIAEMTAAAPAMPKMAVPLPPKK